MKRSKISLSKLFRNDKFLIVFAFVVSCILWFVFSQNSDEETTTVVPDIPINIELSQEAIDNGYEIFSKSAETASVRISGNKITVGTINPDDILVSAQMGLVDAPNSYSTLQLTARQNSNKTNYTILSVDPSIVNVYVDKRRSVDFKIRDDVNYNYTVDSTYYAGTPSYSVDTITVSGPETEVQKIDTVAIIGELSGELQSTTQFQADVVLYDQYGEAINSDLITVSTKSVEVTITVLPEKEVPIKPTFTNVPSGIDVDSIVTVEPSSIIVAGPQTSLTTLPEINLPEIDFSDINPTEDNDFSLEIDLPSDCRNISNQSTAKVTIDLSGYSTTSITVRDFTFRNVADGTNVSATTTDLEVLVAGPQDYIANLTGDDITATIDLRSMGTDFEGSTEIPVTITFDNEYCWAYGDYSINVNVTKTSNSASSG